MGWREEELKKRAREKKEAEAEAKLKALRIQKTRELLATLKELNSKLPEDIRLDIIHSNENGTEIKGKKETLYIGEDEESITSALGFRDECHIFFDEKRSAFFFANKSAGPFGVHYESRKLYAILLRLGDNFVESLMEALCTGKEIKEYFTTKQEPKKKRFLFF